METPLTTKEAEMLALMQGPKLSDRKLCAALDVSQAEAFDLAVSLRRKLGLSDGASLRKYRPTTKA